jgi:hypothetical protein
MEEGVHRGAAGLGLLLRLDPLDGGVWGGSREPIRESEKREKPFEIIMIPP